MPSQQTSQSKNSQSTSRSGTTNSSQSTSASKPPTRYRVIKDGWGNRVNFQASYGLGMDIDDIEEGNRILDALMELDSNNDDRR